MILKRLWWAAKLALFPHLERRQRNIVADCERRKARMTRMSAADDMLATAIMDLSDVLERQKK